jgi:hypothetical protein
MYDMVDTGVGDGDNDEADLKEIMKRRCGEDSSG